MKHKCTQMNTCTGMHTHMYAHTHLNDFFNILLNCLMEHQQVIAVNVCGSKL